MENNLAEDVSLIARAIKERGLEVPAIFFLEANRPILSLANHAATIAMPALSIFIPSSKIQSFQKILESQAAIESLIKLLESSTATKEVV